MKKTLTSEMRKTVENIKELDLEDKIELIKELNKNSLHCNYDGDDESTYIYFYFNNAEISIFSKYEYITNPDGEVEELEEFCDLICNVNIADIEEEEPILLFNTSILTTAGSYKLSDISLKKAKEILENNNFISAIGHESTAKIMSNLLKEKIELNRINAVQKVGQKALVFKLNGRPQEGSILSREEIEKIGYKFQLLERID